MTPHDGTHAIEAPAPILVEEWRGGLAEATHRGRAVVVDASGRVVLAWGDPDQPVYPRSAIKPLQAIPLVESGAADAFSLGDAEIALACASHAGAPAQVACVEAWLARLGLGVGALECGGQPTAAHDNCSGKHAGMLTVAVHTRAPTRGYIARTHPVQQRILGLLEQLSGADLGAAPQGIDGCGIPVFGMGLGNLALAFARFADPGRLPPARAAAIARIAAAMRAEPDMVAGAGKLVSALLRIGRGEILAKNGASGVYVAALPALGLGLALKIEDGASAPAEVALLAILEGIGALDASQREALAGWARPQILNRAGRPVGDLRPAAALLQAGAAP